MDANLQGIFDRIRAEAATHAQGLLPGGKKLDTESIVSAFVMLVGFWIAAVLAHRLALTFFRTRKVDESLSRFLLRVIKISILVMGFVTALGTLGIDVSAIVAGLGLTGLALGIALKDIVSNAVSGIMLLLFRPFRHNDQIKVADFEGEVVDIDLRYTHLKSDGKVIFIPNSLLFANAVTVMRTAAVDASPSVSMSSGNRPNIAPRKIHLQALLADDLDSAAA